jgi:hypothetical protein
MKNPSYSSTVPRIRDLQWIYMKMDPYEGLQIDTTSKLAKQPYIAMDRQAALKP